MNKLIPVIAFALAFASCVNNNKPEIKLAHKDTTLVSNTQKNSLATNSNYFIVSQDSVTILPFEIQAGLTPKAAEKLAAGHETVIVHVFFEGTPKPDAHAELEEDGSFFVAAAEKEIGEAGTVRFDNIKFSRKIYNQLAEKNVQFTVNVYSGRKSSKDNLLDGGFASGQVSDLVNRTTVVESKLISGDD